MGVMSDGYSKKIAKAFEAIYQLHMDASILLKDCDGTIGKGKESVFGNVVMSGLSTTLYGSDAWMPYAVYRYYDATREAPGLVDGVMVYFWDLPPMPDEPMLIVGRIKYRLADDADIRSVCNGWDLWGGAFEWSKPPSPGEVTRLTDVGKGRIEWMKLVLAPLYSIKSMKDVEQLMKSVS
jgi:hypothetical protein